MERKGISSRRTGGGAALRLRSLRVLAIVVAVVAAASCAPASTTVASPPTGSTAAATSSNAPPVMDRTPGINVEHLMRRYEHFDQVESSQAGPGAPTSSSTSVLPSESIPNAPLDPGQQSSAPSHTDAGGNGNSGSGGDGGSNGGHASGDGNSGASDGGGNGGGNDNGGGSPQGDGSHPSGGGGNGGSGDPAPTMGLDATAVYPHEVDLTWTPPGDVNVAAYQGDRGRTGNPHTSDHSHPHLPT